MLLHTFYMVPARWPEEQCFPDFTPEFMPFLCSPYNNVKSVVYSFPYTMMWQI